MSNVIRNILETVAEGVKAAVTEVANATVAEGEHITVFKRAATQQTQLSGLPHIQPITHDHLGPDFKYTAAFKKIAETNEAPTSTLEKIKEVFDNADNMDRTEGIRVVDFIRDTIDDMAEKDTGQISEFAQKLGLPENITAETIDNIVDNMSGTEILELAEKVSSNFGITPTILEDGIITAPEVANEVAVQGLLLLGKIDEAGVAGNLLENTIKPTEEDLEAAQKFAKEMGLENPDNDTIRGLAAMESIGNKLKEINATGDQPGIKDDAQPLPDHTPPTPPTGSPA